MALRDDILSAVASAISTGVANVGQVHSRQRWAARWEDYLDQFASTISGTKQIRGWVVTLAESSPIAGSPDMEGASFGAIVRTYNVKIVGMQALDDSANTESALVTLGESIMDVLDAKKDLGLASVIDYGVGPCTMAAHDHRMFGDVLCNYVEITCSVVCRVAVTYA
jgi:hypothetical protein